MNENYLRYLLSDISPYGDFSIEDLQSILSTLVYEEPDITFLKKEGIKPFEFVKEKSVLELDVIVGGLEWLNTPDMEYFRQRLFESLRVPTQYFSNNPQQSISGYDEFH